MRNLNDKSLAILSNVEELFNKALKFGGVFRIDELSNGSFTVIYKNGLQAQTSSLRVRTLIYALQEGREDEPLIPIKYYVQPYRRSIGTLESDD